MKIPRSIKRDWPYWTMFVCCLFMAAAYLSLRLEECPLPHRAVQTAKPSPTEVTRPAKDKIATSKSATKPKVAAASRPAAEAPPVVASMPAGTIWVKGYYRKDGRWVEPYVRKAPRARQG